MDEKRDLHNVVFPAAQNLTSELVQIKQYYNITIEIWYKNLKF